MTGASVFAFLTPIKGVPVYSSRFRVTSRSLAAAIALLSTTLVASAPADDSAARVKSAKKSITHLNAEMDRYHKTFGVYEDVSSGGNHFHVFAKIPNESAAVTVNGSWTNSPHSGATAIRFELMDTGDNFGGFYFQNGVLDGTPAPVPNFGKIANAGINLTGVKTLEFWGRGEHGGEVVEFFVAGVGRDPGSGDALTAAPDSSEVIKKTVKLGKEWKRYAISLKGKDLSYVLGGFGWSSSAATNPGGVTFFVDDIRYKLSVKAKKKRLKQPRLIRSFATLPVQDLDGCVNDFDFVLRNTAFTYDNALCVLAYLADGSKKNRKRARLLGDALLYAQEHDRTYSDGRVRDAYSAGDIALPPGWKANGKSATVPVPGFYVEADKTFYETHYKRLSTGNNAWAVLALVALHRATGKEKYLDGAIELGSFIRSFKHTSGTYQGFQGGLEDPEATPVSVDWASSEHNLDIAAGFSQLSELTGDVSWQADADHAAEFVQAMWDASISCYRAGTIDPEQRNENQNQLPSDVQTWSILAIPEVLTLHPALLDSVESHHGVSSDGFTGVDFNEDKDGVWFEGTAHLASAYSMAGDKASAAKIRQQLRKAQLTTNFGNGKGIIAASHDCLSTGFESEPGQPFRYFQRLHIGATAWNVFAQRGFNPFTGEPIPK